ncbi:DNA integrity scanning protein DisA [Egibacter rhizosphaerae]|uniref:DNA integrity scanning protein DisA n=1 Tax=Egibacter rhizosphaerae TaxID=1670831 RepID=A0A411YDI1_9ACTN|nr:DNA integrity scanning diadenylate cyclase DisA [Egibacter rhizosphaerae]QBI19265.1 DNA integrity scanning protein DisA [Egibacter rhizosphaerae]
MAPRDERLLAVLQRVAPGTPLREGIDRIIKAGKGAIIVVGHEEEVGPLISGGFKLAAKFTAQRLSEVAKMDGAIVLDEPLERIMFANVHLVPDPKIPTRETGTRHRTAERVARQTGKPVISVSESMRIVSLYVEGMKHTLEEISSVLFRANQALSTLERYRARLDEVSSQLSALEIERAATLRDVATVLQRAEMVRRISDEIEAHVAELGSDGRLLQLQLEELMHGVHQERALVVRDYLPDRRRKVDSVLDRLDGIPAQELLTLWRLAEALGYREDNGDLEQPLSPRGYRMLWRIPRLPWGIVEGLVTRFGTLPRIMEASLEELDEVEGIGEARARSVKEGLARLAESSLLERYS